MKSLLSKDYYRSLVVIISFSLVVSCTSKTKQEAQANQIPKVVTTIGMIYDAVLNIAKGKVEVQALMGPGVDPHLYKATQGDLKKLREADLILYGGLHLEGKMGQVFEKLGRIKSVVAVSETIPKERLHDSEVYENTFDPHVWFDIKLWQYAVTAILRSLEDLDPENKDFFQKNASDYLKRLDTLDAQVKRRILEIPEEQRLIITAHDAFGYFGAAYQIEVKGLQGISTLSEPGLKDISNLVTLITERKIKAVFIETSVSVKAINAVVEGCKQRGHEVIVGGSLYSDAMGEFDTEEGTYIGMVTANVNIIVNALK